MWRDAHTGNTHSAPFTTHHRPHCYRVHTIPYMAMVSLLLLLPHRRRRGLLCKNNNNVTQCNINHQPFNIPVNQWKLAAQRMRSSIHSGCELIPLRLNAKHTHTQSQMNKAITAMKSITHTHTRSLTMGINSARVHHTLSFVIGFQCYRFNCLADWAMNGQSKQWVEQHDIP